MTSRDCPSHAANTLAPVSPFGHHNESCAMPLGRTFHSRCFLTPFPSPPKTVFLAACVTNLNAVAFRHHVQRRTTAHTFRRSSAPAEKEEKFVSTGKNSVCGDKLHLSAPRRPIDDCQRAPRQPEPCAAAAATNDAAAASTYAYSTAHTATARSRRGARHRRPRRCNAQRSVLKKPRASRPKAAISSRPTST